MMPMKRLELAIGRGAGVIFRPQPATQGGRLFCHLRRAGGAAQELRELVKRYEQGRTNAATLAN
jgi:hypothetical protein